MPRATRPARLWLRPASSDRGAVWIILDDGRQHSTGCPSAARASAEKKLIEYLAGKHEPASTIKRRPDQTPIADVLHLYLDEVVPKLARPTRSIARIERLDEWWGKMRLSEVNLRTCQEYARFRNRADRTVRSRKKLDGSQTEMVVKTIIPRSGGGARRDLEDLRAAINHHAKRDLHSGAIEVTLPAKGRPRPKYLTRDEVARLLWVCWRHKREQIPPRGSRSGQRVASKEFYDLRHLARFILMGVYTGSRTTPILKASIYVASDRAFLDLDAELYYRLPEDAIESGNKKSPTSRMSPRLLAHLRRWRDRGLMGNFVVQWNCEPINSIKSAWKRAVNLAQIEGAPTPHSLRHTAVTWLKQQGYSSFDVAGFTGMSEQMVERVYGKHDPNFQRDIASGIGYRRRTK